MKSLHHFERILVLSRFICVHFIEIFRESNIFILMHAENNLKAKLKNV